MKHTQHFYRLSGRIFYFEYLIFAIHNFKQGFEIVINKNDGFDNHHDKDVYFEVTGSNTNGILAVTGLDRDQEKFLCVYFEPVSHSKAQSDYMPQEFNNLLAKIGYNLL
jgi:hypothetical protein